MKKILQIVLLVCCAGIAIFLYFNAAHDTNAAKLKQALEKAHEEADVLMGDKPSCIASDNDAEAACAEQN